MRASSGWLFSSLKCEVLTDATEDEDAAVKSDRPSSIVLYFADSGEAVWDIAEKYNTTVDAVMTENRLTEAHIKEKCRLLIPKM